MSTNTTSPDWQSLVEEVLNVEQHPVPFSFLVPAVLFKITTTPQNYASLRGDLCDYLHGEIRKPDGKIQASPRC